MQGFHVWVQKLILRFCILPDIIMEQNLFFTSLKQCSPSCSLCKWLWQESICQMHDCKYKHCIQVQLTLNNFRRLTYPVVLNAILNLKLFQTQFCCLFYHYYAHSFYDLMLIGNNTEPLHIYKSWEVLNAFKDLRLKVCILFKKCIYSIICLN